MLLTITESLINSSEILKSAEIEIPVEDTHTPLSHVEWDRFKLFLAEWVCNPGFQLTLMLPGSTPSSKSMSSSSLSEISTLLMSNKLFHACNHFLTCCATCLPYMMLGMCGMCSVER